MTMAEIDDAREREERKRQETARRIEDRRRVLRLMQVPPAYVREGEDATVVRGAVQRTQYRHIMVEIERFQALQKDIAVANGLLSKRAAEMISAAPMEAAA
jgi:hypothetical protein